MKLLSIFFLPFCILFNDTNPDGEINYSPRMLIKEMESLSGSTGFQLKGIKLSPGDDEDNMKGRFFEASCGNNEMFTVYIGRVNSCRTGGCTIQAETGMVHEYEYFDYFVIYDKERKIISVRVFNYAASHGVEITARKWLDQFTGYDGSDSLRIGKEIDSISGATISVYSLVAEIQHRTTLLKKSGFSE